MAALGLVFQHALGQQWKSKPLTVWASALWIARQALHERQTKALLLLIVVVVVFIPCLMLFYWEDLQWNKHGQTWWPCASSSTVLCCTYCGSVTHIKMDRTVKFSTVAHSHIT